MVPTDVVVGRYWRSRATAMVTDSIGSGWCAAAASARRVEARFQATRPPPVMASPSSSTAEPVQPRGFMKPRLRIRVISLFGKGGASYTRYLTFGRARNRHAARYCDPSRPSRLYNGFITIKQHAQEKDPAAGPRPPLHSEASHQLVGVRGDRVPGHLVKLVLAVPARADQSGAQQLLHMVGNRPLRDRKLLAQSLTGEFVGAADGLQEGDAAGVGQRLRHQLELPAGESGGCNSPRGHSLMVIKQTAVVKGSAAPPPR